MKIEGVLPFTRKLLAKVLDEGNIAVDATIGNGHDMLYLAELVGDKGMVYGFDIQEDAIHATASKVSERGLSDRVTLFHLGHEHIQKAIPLEHHGKIAGAVFNLGYLPGGDKTIVTRPDTTVSAVHQLLSIMDTSGIIIIVIYPGHEHGAMERDLLLEFARTLDQKVVDVLQYQFINQKNNPPFLIAIEKKEKTQKKG